MKLYRYTYIISLLFLLAFTFGTHKAANAQQEVSVASKYISENNNSYIFVPKSYSKTTEDNYSLIILLHGYGGNFQQWNSITDLQVFANKYDCIIACPDGLKDSWYFNSPLQNNSQYESFFINDYLGYLKTHYSIDTTGIFITGLSMGGHGSMYLFLRHSNLFAAAGSTSGVLDLNYSSLKFSSLSNKLGEYDKHQQRFDDFSAINLLDSIKFTDKPIIFDCGNQDHLYSANKKFKEKCDSLHVNAFYFSFPGNHNRPYWKESIQWHFEFFHRIYENSKE